MISSRPTAELSPQEVRLFESIDGIKTVAELEEIYAGARTAIGRWNQVVQLIPPINAPSHPHLVVIEPHMDDAILSAGGRLLRRRGQARITILTVAKWSNFTSYLLRNRNFTDVGAITDLRLQESELVARLLGAQHRSLDWSDAPLRFWPTEKWSSDTLKHFTSAPQAFVKLFPNPKETALLAEQLTQAFRDLAPDELWIPMGLGDHIDHRMTRSACLRLLTDAQSQFSDVAVSMYEDLPYAANEAHAPQVAEALAACGASIVRKTEDVSDVFEEKMRLVFLYASQFKLSYMEPILRRFGESESGMSGKWSEAYYSLRQLRTAPEECSLSREHAGLHRLRNDAGLMMQENSKRQRLRIIALPSGQIGNWRTVRASLQKLFPDSRFYIYCADETAWQIQGETDEQFTLNVIRGKRVRWLNWIKVIAGEICFRGPVIILWRGAYASEPLRFVKKTINTVMRLLFPFRKVIFARILWDVCCMFEEGPQPGRLKSTPRRPLLQMHKRPKLLGKST